MKLNILICDDNQIELRVNTTYIKSYMEMFKLNANVFTTASSIETKELIKKVPIDIAFLDIDMGNNSPTGINLAAELLKNNPNIINIFITGEMVTIPEVFRVRAFDYIQKPINSNQLKVTFARAIKQSIALQTGVSIEPLIITTNNLKRKIFQHKIICIERIAFKTRILLSNKEELYVYETIKELLKRLNRDFVQVNQGVIINMKMIKEEKKGIITLTNNMVFSIGRTYSKSFKEHYYNHTLG